MHYSCRTLFDITATGITGHYKSASQMSMDAWTRARNQQRNWETLTQIIGLRTQIFDLTRPVKDANIWQFEFTVEVPSVFGPADDPCQVLRLDAQDVPMLNDLDNVQPLPTRLIVAGTEQNIWFDLVPINIQ